MKTKKIYQIKEIYIYIEKIRDNLKQNQTNSHKICKEIHRSFVELQNRLKALEEKLSINDSEIN